MANIIAPSILAADFANISSEVEMLNRSEADWVHIDVMDGMFVPNISFGIPVIEAIKKHSQKPLDVHLMIVQPERYIPAFAAAGADIITVHQEACLHLHRTISQIKDLGLKAGVALNPATPISSLSEVITDLDLALVMSVNPGFGGQKFIFNSLNKIRQLYNLKKSQNPGLVIEVDGGVNLETGRLLVNAGVSALVAGSSVFNASEPLNAISELKKL